MDQNLTSSITKLQSHVSGHVITTSDASYDHARQTFGDKTSRPLIIVQCQQEDDVVQAVHFAREHDLAVSVRSGGHGSAELSHSDGGVVIDLQSMNAVRIIDEAAHTIRIESGATWGKVAQELSDHKLAVTSGDTPSVGVGGLTLGGGFGWMVRTHGLSIDSLIAIDMVDGKGQKLRASEQENPELFWAIRGGGGGFGIATAFEFRAYPCETIYGGHISYPAGNRLTILQKWAEYMRSAPDELNTMVSLLPGFGPDATPQITIGVCYTGDDETAAQRVIQPLRELGDVPLSDDVTRKPYPAMLASVRDASDSRVLVRNGFVRELTPDVLRIIATHFGIPGSSPLEIRSLGGAFSRVPADSTAFAYRDSEALIAMPSFTPATVPSEQAKTVADEAWAPLKPHMVGLYANFLTDMHPDSITQAYPPDTYSRLLKAKKTYDPDNILHLNASVRPE